MLTLQYPQGTFFDSQKYNLNSKCCKTNYFSILQKAFKVIDTIRKNEKWVNSNIMNRILLNSMFEFKYLLLKKMNE